MDKLMQLTPMFLILLSCDPVAQMEANIDNVTSQTLSIEFVSSDVSASKTFELAPGQRVLFQEGFDVGSTFLEPSLAEYDSVIIKNPLNEILIVYKRNEPSKNMYNIKEYWMASESLNGFFKYQYEIASEDIE